MSVAIRRLIDNAPVSEAERAKLHKATSRGGSKQQGRSKLELRFKNLWCHVKGPDLAQEFRFHPERMWRFDFAHEATRTAIEIEGGLYRGGRHQTVNGYREDTRKYNNAQILRWHIFRLTDEDINLEWVELIMRHIATAPTWPVKGSGQLFAGREI